MLRSFTRIALVGAAVAASTVGVMSSSASAADPLGSASLSVASGTNATTFAIASPGSCTGSGGSGYRFHGYIVAASIDASALTYIAGGPSGGTGFQSALFTSTGSKVTNIFPESTPAGLIAALPTFSFNALAGGSITAGEYKVGIICTTGGTIDAGKYWEQKITVKDVTGTGFNWVKGVVPSAPTLASPLTVDNATLNGSFTAPAADPASSVYTITAVPSAGATVTKTVTSTGAFTLGAAGGTQTGSIVNGVTYSVSVTQTNAVGTSAASNSVVSPTVAPPARAAVTNLAANPLVTSVKLTWTAPTGVAPTGYSIAVTGGTFTGSSPFTAGASAVEYTVSGMTAGTTYTFEVTPTHASPFIAGSATVTGVPLPDSYLIQDITVVRPAGALVLTQRCGVNGYLPAVSNDNVFGAISAKAASYDETVVLGTTAGYPKDFVGSTLGSFPTGTAPTTGALAGGPSDSLYSQYPYPVDSTTKEANAVYPTHCGIDLGKGELITSGPRAGQYFKAVGQMNELTLVNTRDADSAWTLNGVVSNFVNAADSAKTFSGNLMGWNPQHTADSGANLDNYNMTVTQGSVVTAKATSDATNGLASAKALSYSTVNASLGMSVENARLKLLIPVTANSGTYTATITFTTI